MTSGRRQQWQALPAAEWLLLLTCIAQWTCMHKANVTNEHGRLVVFVTMVMQNFDLMKLLAAAGLV